MNEDRIVGAVRHVAGKAEGALGRALGNEHLEAMGVVDSVAGAVQNGFGQLKDGIESLADKVPGALDSLADGARDAQRAIKGASQKPVNRMALAMAAGAAVLVIFTVVALRQRKPRKTAKAPSEPRK